VQPGSPAEQAGLRPTRRNTKGELVLGDVITGVDDQPVKRTGDLFNILDGKKVGDKVRIQVRRDGKNITAEATLTALD
jgi:S1-C subfamily serine protease